jgi:hypothetical protein
LGQFTHVWHFIAGGIFFAPIILASNGCDWIWVKEEKQCIGYVKPSLLVTALKLNGINNIFSLAHFTAVKYVGFNLCSYKLGKLLDEIITGCVWGNVES